MRSKISNLVLVLFPISLIIGCAPSWPPLIVSPDYYLSEQFDETINNELIVPSVIDNTGYRDLEITKIKGYSKAFDNNILKLLRKDKNYRVKQISADTSSCKSVTEMKDLSCLSESSIIEDKIDLVLLISIDDYTPPKLFKTASKAKVSAALYSKKLKSFIWRDFRNKYSGDRDIIIFGTFFSDIKDTIYKFYSDEKIYLDCAISHIYSMLWNFPPYIKGNEYEKQIAATNRATW